jgi:phage-related integrase
MSDNSFARHLTAFFTEYLASERGFSHNTIRSYSNTFVSFLSYMESACHVKPERMELKYVNRSNVLSFLDWLQDNNGIKDTTRNQRLAAIHPCLLSLYAI